MKNKVSIFAFSKENKSAEKRLNDWLASHGIEVKTVKVWSIDFGRSRSRSRYAVSIEVDIDGNSLELSRYTNDSLMYDEWTDLDSDDSFKLDRFRSKLIEFVCTESEGGRLADQLAED